MSHWLCGLRAICCGILRRNAALRATTDNARRGAGSGVTRLHCFVQSGPTGIPHREFMGITGSHHLLNSAEIPVVLTISRFHYFSALSLYHLLVNK